MDRTTKHDIPGDSATMDTTFIGKPHYWDPRRVYSQTGADWQYRVDFDRLRKERLQRLREQMSVTVIAASNVTENQ